QKLSHARPIVGGLESQEQTDLATRTGLSLHSLPAAQCARRTTVQRHERLVESADTPEARRERDLGHRQRRLVDELLREQHAAGLSDRDRRGTEMLATQAPELALAQSQAAGQGIDAPLVQGSQLDQRQRAGYRVRGAPPGSLVRCRL